MGVPLPAARKVVLAVKDLSCVDVVIPVFNGQETIQAALESVLAQQGVCISKVIVVDDGSTDGTAEVVENLGSALIQFVRTENQGVAAARNLGIEKTTAQWVAFLDADDLWMPGKLETQLVAAFEHDAGFVCSSISSQSTMVSGLISTRLLAGGNFVATSSVLVKRDVLLQAHPVFAPGMSFAEDYLAWLKSVTLTRGYYISTKLVDYIVSDHPRYHWGQILPNLVFLNFRYAKFLRKLGASPPQRLELGVVLLLGTLRSVLSIIKRFIGSYRVRVPSK